MTCLYICLSVIHVFAQTREHGRTGEFNILDFGATRDTMMVHTKAINEAIESCYRQGGGRVVIPPGKFKTGTIFLKDKKLLCICLNDSVEWRLRKLPVTI